MVRLPDTAQAAPVRRTSIARGILQVNAAGLAALKDPAAPFAAAQAAAMLAAKSQHLVVATALPVQLTDAFCDLAVEGNTVTATMTVQAFARQPIEGPALAGAAAALLALLDVLGGSERAGGRITDLHVVQNVVL